MVHRAAVVCLEILLALVLAVVLAGAVLAWRLSEGPIVVDGLKPYVEEMLSRPDGGFDVRVGTTEVAWSGWDRAFDLVARDVSVIETGETTRAHVDAVAVGISARALLDGRLAPKRIDVIDPRITVVRTAGGAWRLTPEAGTGGDFDLVGLLDAFSGVTPESWLSDLLQVEVSGARVRLVDAERNVSVVAESVSMELLRTREGLAFHGGGRLAWGGGGRTPLEVRGAYLQGQGTVRAELRLNDLPIASVAALHPSLSKAAGLAIPVSGVVRVASGMTGVGLHGDAELTFGPGTVSAAGYLETPLDIASGTLAVRVEPDLEQANLNLALDLHGPTLAISATAARFGSGYDVAVDAAAEAVPVSDLDRYWPQVVGSGARGWVTENLQDGVVPQATAKATAWLDPRDLGTLRLDTLAGRIDFTGVTTHYFRPLPPVIGVEGVAVFDRDAFDISLAGGQLGRLAVQASRVQIKGLVAEEETTEIEVALRGPLIDALRVIDHEPLGYPKQLGLKIDQVEGQFGARLRFDFPLLRDLSIDQVKLAVAANLTDVRLPEAVDEQTLDDADLKLELDGAGMKLSGTGKVLGAPAEVSLDQRFHERGPYTSRSRIKTTATRERLAAFGVDLGNVIGGQMAVDAQVETRPDGTGTLRVNADLRETVLDLEPLGWRKPAGSSGTLRTVLTLRSGNPVAIDEFDLRTGDTVIQAIASLGPMGVPKMVDLARLRLGRTDAAGQVERLETGEWRIALKGSTIDLSPIIDGDENQEEQRQEDAPGTAERLKLDVRLAADTLVLTRKASLSPATLSLRRNGKRIEAVDLRGRLGDGSVSLVVRPIEQQRQLSLRADNAGDFLRALEIVDTIQGGRLDADGWVTGDEIHDGLELAARIEEFRVVNAPVLARILSIASFVGLADVLRGEGVRFARAFLDLTLKPNRIEARNAVAYGPGLGLKAEGAYDRNSKLVDVVGMIAPAYSLSRLIDKIPVLGELLTGGEGEGLLATEFRVRGNFDDPSVTVNPLTALAPGFLRDLLSTAERPADSPVVAPPPSSSGPPGRQAP